MWSRCSQYEFSDEGTRTFCSPLSSIDQWCCVSTPVSAQKPRCDECGTACSKCGPAGQVQVSAGLAGSHSGGDTITGCGSCTASPLKCPCFVFVYFCLVTITCLAYVLLLLLLLCDAVIYVAFNRLPRRGMQLCQRANDQTLCWCAGRMEEEK